MIQQGKIGILTSGGDCSGLNSIIRAAFLRAAFLGYSLVGIKDGLRGLAIRPPELLPLSPTNCSSSLLTTSGSILGSNAKSLLTQIGATNQQEVNSRIVSGYKELGLDALICVGGNGSIEIIFHQFKDIQDINFVMIPKTIDNDVGITDYSVGFYTAVDVAAEAILNARSSAESHGRIMVIEVMGRCAGFIAFYAGIATGADVILTQEFKYEKNLLKEKVSEIFIQKRHCIIVVSEAIEAPIAGCHSSGDSLAAFLYLETGIEARAVVLGHVQRGGKTTVVDRILGTAFGTEAVNLVHKKQFGTIVGFNEGRIVSKKLTLKSFPITKYIKPSDKCVTIAKEIGIYIGET
jgi:6-phosphofructokinase 1